MAVINEVDDLLTHPQPASKVGGKKLMEVIRVFTIAAGDDDGSKWLLAEVPGTAQLVSAEIEGAAVTGMTDVDFGFYDVEGNAVDADKLADGLDLSSTTGLPTGPLGDPVRQVMSGLALTDADKPVAELAGHVVKALPATGETRAKEKYRIAMTANTVGSGAGTFCSRVKYLMEP